MIFEEVDLYDNLFYSYHSDNGKLVTLPLLSEKDATF